MNPAGLVIIPTGDPLLESALNLIWKGRILRLSLQDMASNSVSFSKHSSDQSLPSADQIGYFDLNNSSLKVDEQIYELPLPGKHNAFNLMFALAVAREMQLSIDTVKRIDLSIPKGRNQELTIGGLTILDETYNSSPEAVDALLELLVSIPGRHFAVLGTMLELGDQSLNFHRNVTRRVVELGLDGLVIVADNAEAEVMAEEAKGMARFAIVQTPEDAAKPLHSWLKAGDVVLLKASRAISLERVIPLLPKIDL